MVHASEENAEESRGGQVRPGWNAWNGFSWVEGIARWRWNSPVKIIVAWSSPESLGNLFFVFLALVGWLVQRLCKVYWMCVVLYVKLRLIFRNICYVERNIRGERQRVAATAKSNSTVSVVWYFFAHSTHDYFWDLRYETICIRAGKNCGQNIFRRMANLVNAGWWDEINFSLVFDRLGLKY